MDPQQELFSTVLMALKEKYEDTGVGVYDTVLPPEDTPYPFIYLADCSESDQATGLMASKYRSQDINSYKSIRGIFKKVSMWLLVVVGAIIDELLLYAATTIGKPVPVTFLIACVVAMWLICNEIISILENIQDMGVNIPAFLQPLVKHIRSQVEEQINIDKKEDKNSEDE